MILLRFLLRSVLHSKAIKEKTEASEGSGVAMENLAEV